MAAAGGAASAGPTRDSTATSNTPEYGLHQDLTFDGYAWRRDQAIGLASSVHAQISRNSLLWAKIEPTQGALDWTIPDAVVQGLSAKRIEPLFVLYGSPSWVNGTDPATPDASLYVPPAGQSFEVWLDRYATFVRLAVQRYHGSVHKWEIWNEPNERYFWKPRPDVALYSRFYTRIRDTILRVDPGAQVAIGGLAGLCCSVDIPGVSFLDQLLAQKIPIDIVAIHPYAGKGQSPDAHVASENNFDDIAMIRQHLVRAGKPVPIWVTEWGWSSTAVGQAKQATYVGKSLDLLRTAYPYVTVATYFLDYDRGTTYQQGLFDSSFRPKPAAAAFSRFMQSVAEAAPIRRTTNTPAAAAAALP
jgi:hypothetical protein